MLYVFPKSGAILQSKVNTESTCTCTYNVLLVRFLRVSTDWIEIQFTKKNSCLCYMSIHVPIFTINLTFSPLDVALQLAEDSFIPQPLPIPSHPFTLNNFCTRYVFKFVILILSTFPSQQTISWDFFGKITNLTKNNIFNRYTCIWWLPCTGMIWG